VNSGRIELLKIPKLQFIHSKSLIKSTPVFRSILENSRELESRLSFDFRIKL
jgi:hypothetical protein